MATFWNGYTFKDFLFEDFDINTPAGFAGVFVGLFAISISFEGIRTLRDYLYGRFLASAKGSNTEEQRSKSSSPPSVRYSKNGCAEDEAEQERLTGNGAIGPSGDAPVLDPNAQSTSAGIRSEDQDILIDREEKSRNGDTHEDVLPSPYGDTTFPVNVGISQKRRRELADLMLSSLLHMIYITMGYILMLAVMTFNTYILIAVTVGIGFGFYVFGPIRNSREFAIFKYFESGDPCQERLLPSHDPSHKTESSSAGSGHEACHTVADDGDNNRTGSGVVIGVQVHHQDLLTQST